MPLSSKLITQRTLLIRSLWASIAFPANRSTCLGANLPADWSEDNPLNPIALPMLEIQWSDNNGMDTEGSVTRV